MKSLCFNSLDNELQTAVCYSSGWLLTSIEHFRMHTFNNHTFCTVAYNVFLAKVLNLSVAILVLVTAQACKKHTKKQFNHITTPLPSLALWQQHLHGQEQYFFF